MHQSDHAPSLRPLREVPLPRLGILGGGQLSRMTASAAAKLGCEVVVLEREVDSPANSRDTHAIVGDWNDTRALLDFAPLVDVVTLENEFVDPRVLAALEDGRHRLWPSSATLALVQDKLRQKEVFAAIELPMPRFAPAPTRESVLSFGFPSVLKRRFNAYDGKGNATVHSAADLPAAWARLDGDGHGLYVEELCTFSMELATIVTRAEDGALARYPVVETVQREHVCHIVKAPAAIAPETAGRASDLAARAVEAIRGVGSFGVEFFHLADGSLLLNEIAPRVHNSGHYTIEACACSQFENHLRAVLGWPLGSTAMVAPAAVMVNLLGYGDGTGVPRGLVDALRIPGASVHIYGKTRSTRGRKMGHVTALGRDLEEAAALAQRAADCIRFGGDG
jgi:5-(carboxyamino)imidazole ribonucleotide synthase